MACTTCMQIGAFALPLVLTILPSLLLLTIKGSCESLLMRIGSFIVVVLFGFILILQFLAMLVHRFSTLKHFLARAPYFRSSGKNVIYDLSKQPDEARQIGFENPMWNVLTEDLGQ